MRGLTFLAALLASSQLALGYDVARAAATTTAPATGSAVPTTDPSGGDPFPGVCFPRLNNGSFDEHAPCRAALVIPLRCPQDNHTRDQECFCKKGEPGYAFWENARGCLECRRLHGLRNNWFPAQLVPSLSSSYCAIASPTANLPGYIESFVKSATVSVGTSTPTDVLGTSTAISDYFTSTPVAAATTTVGSVANGTGTSAGISAAGTGTGSTSTSASVSHGAGAVATAAPLGAAMLAGVVGLAALL